MTVTLDEAKSLIVKAQYESAVRYFHTSDWLKNKHGDEATYRNYLDSYAKETPDWGAGVNFIEVDGHTVESVEEFGGEGQGDELWVVYRIDDQLFKKDGYWVSHDGSYWDGDFYEVEPYEITITKYRKVN